ncbi:S26 family signal peptidase [Sphingomonas sp. RB1R13]|uniref:S26 family signal peptidase n=1 Tax=Sphingomonas sp. RB1R13 TaxID=3096159 RepID=UPI002FC9B50B
MFEAAEEGGLPPAEPGIQIFSRHRSLLIRASLIGLGIGILLGTIAHPPKVRLLWNASASAPVGLYLITPGTSLEIGDMVAVRTPAGVRKLAAMRGYLPSGVPLVKRIAAMQGSRVCAMRTRIIVNGLTLAHRRKRDAEGRLMPWWNGCRRLRAGQFLLLNRPARSFDSRYFGPVANEAIHGKAVLLWQR